MRMRTKVYIRIVYFILFENNLKSYSGIKYHCYDTASFVFACGNKPFKRPEGVYGILLGVGPTMPTYLPLLYHLLFQLAMSQYPLAFSFFDISPFFSGMSE